MKPLHTCRILHTRHSRNQQGPVLARQRVPVDTPRLTIGLQLLMGIDLSGILVTVEFKNSLFHKFKCLPFHIGWNVQWSLLQWGLDQVHPQIFSSPVLGRARHLQPLAWDRCSCHARHDFCLQQPKNSSTVLIDALTTQADIIHAVIHGVKEHNKFCYKCITFRPISWLGESSSYITWRV